MGLVGPNGAGKTTVFRMINGEEQPDEGQVSVERGVTIGYFNQDVGEMAGPQRRRRGDERRRSGQHRCRRIARSGGGHGRSRASRQHGRDHRALRRGAGALRGTGRLCARGAAPARCSRV
ncbi:ATP-binding cassette domain-containing protein [Rhizobium beringeri]